METLGSPTRWSAYVWLAVAALASADGSDVRFVNKCSTPIELYNLADRERNATVIASGAAHASTNLTGYNYFRHSASSEATLVSLRIDRGRGVSYDISIIPPQAMYCSSFETCREEAHGQRGFNVPVRVVPQPPSSPTHRCKPISCGADDPQLCADAFLFPADSSNKYGLCDPDTSFQIEFCPEGSLARESAAGPARTGDSAHGQVTALDLQSSGSIDDDAIRGRGGAITFGQASPSPAMVPTSTASTPAPAPISFDVIAGSEPESAVGGAVSPANLEANSSVGVVNWSA